MFEKRGEAPGAAARVVPSVLLFLSFCGVAGASILLLLRVRTLTATVVDLEDQLVRAGSAARVENDREASPPSNWDSPPKPLFADERTPAEREAIHALALVCAITDTASERAFFTSYDVYEMSGMVMEVEEGLRRIVRKRPRHKNDPPYWRMREDEQFKKSHSGYVKRIKDSIRKHSLQ